MASGRVAGARARLDGWFAADDALPSQRVKRKLERFLQALLASRRVEDFSVDFFHNNLLEVLLGNLPVLDRLLRALDRVRGERVLSARMLAATR